MERYMYRAPDWNGEFRHVASGWEEYQNLIRVVTFTEESRAFDSITLFDATRNIRVLLPIGGGQVFFRQGTATTWTPLANTSVDRIEPTFTPTQQCLSVAGLAWVSAWVVSVQARVCVQGGDREQRRSGFGFVGLA